MTLLSYFTEAYCILFMWHICGQIVLLHEISSFSNMGNNTSFCMLLRDYCSFFFFFFFFFPQTHNWCQTEFRWTGWRKLACPLREQTIENGASGLPVSHQMVNERDTGDRITNTTNQTIKNKTCMKGKKHRGENEYYQIFILFKAITTACTVYH